MESNQFLLLTANSSFQSLHTVLFFKEAAYIMPGKTLAGIGPEIYNEPTKEIKSQQSKQDEIKDGWR